MTGVLAQRCLQEEEWYSTGDQEQNVRNEESPFKIRVTFIVIILHNDAHR